jgi:hypothetical protein
MSDQSAPVPPADAREAMVLRYWRRGDLTPLRLANALAREAAASRRHGRSATR